MLTPADGSPKVADIQNAQGLFLTGLYLTTLADGKYPATGIFKNTGVTEEFIVQIFTSAEAESLKNVWFSLNVHTAPGVIRTVFLSAVYELSARDGAAAAKTESKQVVLLDDSGGLRFNLSDTQKTAVYEALRSGMTDLTQDFSTIALPAAPAAENAGAPERAPASGRDSPKKVA